MCTRSLHKTINSLAKNNTAKHLTLHPSETRFSPKTWRLNIYDFPRAVKEYKSIFFCKFDYAKVSCNKTRIYFLSYERQVNLKKRIEIKRNKTSLNLSFRIWDNYSSINLIYHITIKNKHIYMLRDAIQEICKQQKLQVCKARITKMTYI